MKKFKGKALYQPTGKAAEYASWAVNFYTGCSNDCEYCYCKRGVLSHVWDNKPHLKKCFTDQNEALKIFKIELEKNVDQVRKEGIFFSFTTDPMLHEIFYLTEACVAYAVSLGVPVKILTKNTDWVYLDFLRIRWTKIYREIANNKRKISIGYTLTGADELEPNASPHMHRINALKILKDAGFKTWASIEPVINPTTALQIIQNTKDICDEYKVGLRSGVKKDYYDPEEMEYFYQSLITLSKTRKIYLKDSVLKYFGLQREKLPTSFKSK